MNVSIPFDLAPVSDALDSPGGGLALPTGSAAADLAAPVAEPSESGSEVADPAGEELAQTLGLPIDGEPETLLEAALHKWSSELVLATSLQAEGLVMLDLLHRRTRGALGGLRVITLDTGRLPEETHTLIDVLGDRYGVQVEIHAPDPEALAALVAESGSNGFRKSLEARRACCRVRKVEPLQRALQGAAAWISGLRRDQSEHRGDIATVEIDDRGLVKLNPLADWSWEQVWAYVRRYSVPYHPFYDRGYTSIGCSPCTRAIRPWEDRRAGRWWWETESEAKECGLHWTRPSTSNEALEGTPGSAQEDAPAVAEEIAR